MLKLKYIKCYVIEQGHKTRSDEKKSVCSTYRMKWIGLLCCLTGSIGD